MSRDPIGPRPTRIARLFPVIRLLKAVGMAFEARPLILSAAGLVLSWVGWQAIDRAFGHADGPVVQAIPAGPIAPMDLSDGLAVFGSLMARASEPFRAVVAPFFDVFSTGQGPRGFLRASMTGVWAVLVWGIVGGAIARIAAVQHATGDRIGMGTALRFALSHAAGLVGGPLCPMIGLGFFAALCGGMGLLYQLGPIGSTVAGIFAFLPLMAGLIMAMLLVGLAVGWPLMIATVAVESEDAFDALSRSYSYVYGRPLRYAGYALVSWLAGAIGLLVAWAFALLIVHLARWGLSFGGPDLLIDRLFLGNAADDPGATPHAFWLYVIRLLAHGWIYGYFFIALTLVYLQLRRDVDRTPYADLADLRSDDEPFAPPPEILAVGRTDDPAPA